MTNEQLREQLADSLFGLAATMELFSLGLQCKQEPGTLNDSESQMLMELQSNLLHVGTFLAKASERFRRGGSS